MKRVTLQGIATVILVAGFGIQSVVAQPYKEAYNAAIAAAEAKNYSEAYTQYKAAAKGATEAGDTDVASKSKETLAKLVRVLGTEAYKAGNYTEAIAKFDEGLGYDPGYVLNTYMKGLALKKTGQEDEAMKLLAEVAKSNDRKTARAADKAIRTHYHAKASELIASNAFSSSDAAKSIAYLETMQEYVPADANTFYYLGVAYTGSGQYDKAVEFADKALAIHRGGRSDQAKIHYMKGEALMHSGNNDAAKLAFAQAVYGSYKQSAQHYLDTL